MSGLSGLMRHVKGRMNHLKVKSWFDTFAVIIEKRHNKTSERHNIRCEGRNELYENRNEPRERRNVAKERTNEWHIRYSSVFFNSYRKNSPCVYCEKCIQFLKVWVYTMDSEKKFVRIGESVDDFVEE